MASRFDSGCEHQNMGVVLMVARWIPNPKVRVQILAPMPGGRSSVVELFVANEVVVSSNLIVRSILYTSPVV